MMDDDPAPQSRGATTRRTIIPKSNIGFTLYRTLSNGGYHHLYIDVREKGYGSGDPVVRMKWQAEPSTDHWYGFTATIEGSRTSQIREAARFLMFLIPDAESGWGTTPESVLDAFALRNHRRLFYDRRV